jgi:hypothetical protein
MRKWEETNVKEEKDKECQAMMDRGGLLSNRKDIVHNCIEKKS